MKFSKIFTAVMLVAAMAACDSTVPDNPNGGPGGNNGGNNGGNPDTTIVTPPAKADTITIQQALDILAAMEPKAETEEAYYMMGKVSYVQTTTDNLLSYGNCNFKITDETNATGFSIWYTNYLNNQPFTDVAQIPVVGDDVVVYGKLKNYVNSNTGATTPEMTNGYIVEITRNGGGTVDPGEYIDVTIPEAIAIANALTPGGKTSEYYRVKDVIVDQIFTTADKVTTYGNINLSVKDAEGNTISSYYTNNIDNVKFTSSTQIPAVGATVTIVGPLKSYVKGDATTPEFENGWFTAISEVVGGEEPEPTPEPEAPTSATVTTTETGAIVLDFATNPLGLTSDWEIKASASFALGETGITMTLDGSANTQSGTKVLTNQFRMYKNTTFTLAAPAGKNITNIAFETAGTVSGKDYSCSNMSVVDGGGAITIDSANAANAAWEGSANVVKFTNNNQVRINKMTITME